jgi:hypothetical protein
MESVIDHAMSKHVSTTKVTVMSVRQAVYPLKSTMAPVRMNVTFSRANLMVWIALITGHVALDVNLET